MRRFFFLSMKSGKEHRVTSEELVRLNYRGSGSAWRGAVVPSAFVLLLAFGVMAVGLGSNPALPHAPVSSSLPTFLAPAANHMAAVPSQTSLVRLPLIFEPNQGQTAPQVQFLAHGAGHGLFLTGDGAVLSMRDSAGKTAVIRMALDGANKNPAASGDEQLPGKSNYFIGNDPAKWHRDIPQFARVSYENVYPGVDLVYCGNQGRLEYDFKIAPGADPRRVALRFEAPQKPRLDAQATCCSAAVCVSKPHTFIRKSETRSGPWRDASRWPATESLLKSGTTIATARSSSIRRLDFPPSSVAARMKPVP